MSLNVDMDATSLHFSEPEMIPIPAGEFLMGSDPAKDPHARKDEEPLHTVFVSGFSIGKTPVTNRAYALFLKTTSYDPPAHWKLLFWKLRTHPLGRAAYPVVNVSWHDARAYCEWLSAETGARYRLPTEAEWEKAARGTDGRIYPWGGEWSPNRCHISERSEAKGTVPVGTYPEGSSPYGAQDMLGNIWEWTTSLWGKNLRAASFTYPYLPADGRENESAASDVRRVLRGVSYLSNFPMARCATRYRYSPRNFFPSVGFRLARDGLIPLRG